jgi:hypothetical protein
MGYSRNPLEFGYGTERAIFDAIAHDPAGKRRPYHWKCGELVQPREIEIDGRARPERATPATGFQLRFCATRGAARRSVIPRVECEANRVEVETTIPVCLPRVPRSGVDRRGLPGPSPRGAWRDCRSRRRREGGRVRAGAARDSRCGTVARFSLGTAHGDRGVDGFDLSGEPSAIAGEFRRIMRMKLTPPAHGDTECGNGREEEERAALAWCWHRRQDARDLSAECHRFVASVVDFARSRSGQRERFVPDSTQLQPHGAQ